MAVAHSRLANTEVRRAGELVSLARRTRAAFPKAAFPDLELNELQVLLALVADESDGLTVDAIAELLGLGSSTISHALPALRTAGLVETRADRDDGRRRVSRATKRGSDRAAQFLAEAPTRPGR